MPIPSSADIQGTSDLLTVTYLPRGSSYVTLDTIYPEECSLEESCRDQDLWCQRFFKKVRQTHTGVNPFLTVNIWDFERSTALTANFYFVRTPPMKGKGNCLLERNSIMFAQVKDLVVLLLDLPPRKDEKVSQYSPDVLAWFCKFCQCSAKFLVGLRMPGIPNRQIPQVRSGFAPLSLPSWAVY